MKFREVKRLPETPQLIRWSPRGNPGYLPKCLANIPELSLEGPGRNQAKRHSEWSAGSPSASGPYLHNRALVSQNTGYLEQDCEPEQPQDSYQIHSSSVTVALGA